MDPQGQYSSQGQLPPPQAPPQGYPPQGPPSQGYPPSSQAYPPPSAMRMQPLPMGFEPTQCDCPGCGASIVTDVTFVAGTMAWIAFLILLFLGVTAICSFFPFCMDGCKDAIHRCPACGRELTRIRRC